ncbi:Pyruvate dehydrogenase E1 component subunit beta-1 mitochondrial [Bienertia sinuspersici]
MVVGLHGLQEQQAAALHHRQGGAAAGQTLLAKEAVGAQWLIQQRVNQSCWKDQRPLGRHWATSVVEDSSGYLDAPVERISSADIPMPSSTEFEKMAIQDIVRAAKRACYRNWVLVVDGLEMRCWWLVQIWWVMGWGWWVLGVVCVGLRDGWVGLGLVNVGWVGGSWVRSGVWGWAGLGTMRLGWVRNDGVGLGLVVVVGSDLWLTGWVVGLWLCVGSRLGGWEWVGGDGSVVGWVGSGLGGWVQWLGGGGSEIRWLVVAAKIIGGGGGYDGGL